MPDQPFFVSVAAVAASLLEVRSIAGELLLAAINAKVIALRAGSEAAGFQPITDFIDQTARVTATLGDAIEAGTQTASRLAVDERRASDALRRLIRAVDEAGTGAPSLRAVIARCDQRRSGLSDSVDSAVGSLDELLREIGKRMRSISVITVQSRVEAQQAGTHRTDLEAVAASMSAAADQVTAIVRQSRRSLHVALELRAKHLVSA